MKPTHKRTLLLLLLSLAGLSLTACNTMQGLGKDTERAGEKIQENSKH